MYLLVSEEFGPACAIMPGPESGTIRPVGETLKKHKAQGLDVIERQTPHVPECSKKNRPVSRPVTSPVGKFNRVLRIVATRGDERGETIGFLTWRKKDNHKSLWVVRNGVAKPHAAKLPQTKKTSIPDLAKILGIGPATRLDLRNVRALYGHASGGPVFRSSSVCGWGEM